MNKGLIYNGRKLIEKEFTDDRSYEFLRDSVEGYIERIPLTDFENRDIDMWCNEEGKMNGLPPTIVLTCNGNVYDLVVGNVCFTKHNDEGETLGLADEDINFIKSKFKNDGLVNGLLQRLEFKETRM